MQKSRLGIVALVAVGAVGLLWTANVLKGLNSRLPVAQTSPLLEKVQALGDLHAVKYTYRDVHEYSSFLEADGAMAYFPGASQLAEATTKNRALMTFTGSVEAGVDLSKAQIEQSPSEIVVFLPEPRIFPAQIDAQVHDVKRGLLWRDDAITITALTKAKRRFADTSRRQGILDEARANVRKQVSELASQLSDKKVTVKFADEDNVTAKSEQV